MWVRWAALASGVIGCAEPQGDAAGWQGEPAPAEVGTPIGAETVAVIGPDGGELTSADGGFRLAVPAGALSEDTELSLQALTNTAWGGVGDAFRVSPAVGFDAPVEVRFGYTDDDLLGTVDEALGIAAQDAEGYWVAFGDGAVDVDARTLTVETQDLGSPVPLGRAAGGAIDFARHARARLEPGNATVELGESLGLALMATTDQLVWPFDDPSGIALSPPMPYTHDGAVAWSVVGSPAGTVTGSSSDATYVAPSSTAAEGKTNTVVASLSSGVARLVLEATVRIAPGDSWYGYSLLTGPGFSSFTDLTWTLDSTHGDEQWFVPSGKVTFEYNDTGDCVVEPLTHEVAATDGLLVIDHSTEPATYSGYGVVVWVVTTTCPDAAPISLPLPVVFLGDAEGVVETLGTLKSEDGKTVIRDGHDIDDASIEWQFTQEQ